MSDKMPDWYTLSKPIGPDTDNYDSRTNGIFIKAVIVVIVIYLSIYFFVR